jgi:hypothetical protein
MHSFFCVRVRVRAGLGLGFGLGFGSDVRCKGLGIV